MVVSEFSVANTWVSNWAVNADTECSRGMLVTELNRESRLLVSGSVGLLETDVSRR